MYYKFQIPTIASIIINADRPENFRELTRHAPIFFPAPPVVWIPEIPGRKSRVFVGVSMLCAIRSLFSHFASA